MLTTIALQTDFIFSFLTSLGILFLISFLLYVYYAITLMIIARQTATRNSGLAWLPIGNLILMSNIGRRPVWWALLCFIPVLNLLFLAMLWMSIAEVRGKPAWTGSLAIIPIIGLIVPAYLAIGKQSSESAATIASRNCNKCGTPIIGSEAYCRNCGETSPTIVTSQSRMPAGQMALIGAGSTLVTFILFGVVGWFIFFRALSYEAPDRKQPDIPERTAGTMTEFPVDTDKDSPTEPGSVIVEGEAGAGKEEIAQKIPKERFPPGTTPESIRKRTTTRTSVVYRKKKKEGQPPTSQDPVIYITVVRVQQGLKDVADAIAAEIVNASSGNRTGVNVQSPRGGTYRGSRIRTSQSTIYVLEKQNSDIVVIIYSPTTAGDAIATRLAQNIGNGDGLNDYPSTRTTIWTLPQRPPGNLTLVDFSTQTREEMGLSDSDLQRAEQGQDAETRRLIQYFSQFIPERATQARYRDSQGRRWEVVIYDYESTRRAWNTWLFLRWTVGFGSGGSVRVKDGDGLYIDTNEGRILLFQRGPYLIFIRAPSGTSTDTLAALGNSVQV